MVKLERLVAIIMLLLQRPRISAQALAEMFEVSLRTIYREMETINRSGVLVGRMAQKNRGEKQ